MKNAVSLRKKSAWKKSYKAFISHFLIVLFYFLDKNVENSTFPLLTLPFCNSKATKNIFHPIIRRNFYKRYAILNHKDSIFYFVKADSARLILLAI